MYVHIVPKLHLCFWEERSFNFPQKLAFKLVFREISTAEVWHDQNLCHIFILTARRFRLNPVYLHTCVLLAISYCKCYLNRLQRRQMKGFPHLPFPSTFILIKRFLSSNKNHYKILKKKRWKELKGSLICLKDNIILVILITWKDRFSK